MSGFISFVALYVSLDRTTSTSAKRAAMAAYFQDAPPADLAWAVFVLTGRRMRRPLSGSLLRDWASVHTGLPPWLIEASYHTVGDLGETLALLCSRNGLGDRVPGASSVSALSLAQFIERDVVPLPTLPDEERQRIVLRWWNELDEVSCFVAHKLVTGALRVGVSSTLASRALADATGHPPDVIEHRLMGPWEPTPAFAERLRAADDGGAALSRPYPFALATQLDIPAATLGPREEWQVEWKWDGIRAQLIARGGDVFLWSRGEELVTDRFPEIAAAARALPPGTVLDGEVVIMRREVVQPFGVLQTRIGRTHLSPRLLRESPACFLAFDVLEFGGQDVRESPLRERRRALDHALGSSGTVRASEVLAEPEWEALAARRDGSRARGVEGLMIKRLASPYRGGRSRGDWWKWKVDPYTMDAVLVYAQAGHGKRAALYTDYTFGVWDGGTLVPVAAPQGRHRGPVSADSAVAYRQTHCRSQQP